MSSPAKHFADIAVGEAAQFAAVLDEQLIREFAALSGDQNPLHTDAAYAAHTPFKGVVAHGMLAGAFFSRLVGMYLPGLYSVYLSQTLLFHKAIVPGTEVIVSGTVIQKSEATRSVIMDMRVMDVKSKDVLVSGEARVRLLQ